MEFGIAAARPQQFAVAPCSVIRPPPSTRIWSAARAVASRCVTSSSVRSARSSSKLEGRIARVLGKLLGVPAAELDPTRLFFELGATSLTLVRAHRELSAELDRPLTVLDLFAQPSIRELAAHLTPRTAEPGAAEPGAGEPEDDVLAVARSRGRSRRLARR